MIYQIRGNLLYTDLKNNLAVVECGNIAIELMLTTMDIVYLRETHVEDQKEVSFYTELLIDGRLGMGTLYPRMIGFIHKEDRDFFKLITSVSGFGYKKVLKMMAAPSNKIAIAIERKDITFLRSLPELGPKLAKKLIMELRGRIEPWLGKGYEEGEGSFEKEVLDEDTDTERDVMEVLLRLGYTTSEARSMIYKTLKSLKARPSAEKLIQEIFLRYGQGK